MLMILMAATMAMAMMIATAIAIFQDNSTKRMQEIRKER